MTQAMQINVLVADENALIQNVVRLSLTPPIYHIIEAQQGLDALDLFNEHLPHLVLIDTMITGEIDGMTLCQLIKSMKLPHACFVVMLLPKATAQDIAACFAAGADDYLVKPLTPAHLVKIIEALSEKKQATATLVTQHESTSLCPVSPPYVINYEALSGFDSAALRNLETMLGSKEKVFDSLKRFIIDFSGIIDEISDLFLSEQRELTQRKLHSLKGTAAIIGANILSALAADIEAHVVNGDNIHDKLVALHGAWQTVNHTVTTMLPLEASDI